MLFIRVKDCQATVQYILIYYLFYFFKRFSKYDGQTHLISKNNSWPLHLSDINVTEAHIMQVNDYM